MSLDQIVTLCVLVAVVAALILDRTRADVVALCGAAALLISGAVRPIEVQGAFASPAIIALASLFVIAYAMELSGLLDAAIRRSVALCQRIGATGLWLLIGISGAASAFLNNTPIVVMGAPVVRDVALRLGLPPKRFLMPLSYIAVLGGCCTLIGTSTNLLVNDMASISGQPRFGIFEIAPVGVCLALVGAIYLLFASERLLSAGSGEEGAAPAVGDPHLHDPDFHHAQLGSADLFVEGHPLKPWKALTAIGVFVTVVTLAALDIAPIAAAAFTGAVLLIVLRVISADEAYQGLRPEILILIAGMVVLGIALEETGLASAATGAMVGSLDSLHPLLALILLYGATLFLTELLSNATVAVLITPMAVALAEALAVNPRPFLVAIMMAGSAAFATPFGYQTNVIVFQMGGYSYMDFVRVGLPLNFITWAAAMVTIPYFFPF
ncbi:MAG: SLC13 family permease [Pseudomonadota bacterium]|nr:SLC13 family permease [Pseudomonadota bacterium]